MAAVAVIIAVAAYLTVGRGSSGEQERAALSVLKTSDFHSLAFSPSEPNVIFFGHHNGVMRSDDGGRSWHPLVERANFDAMALAVNPQAPDRIYAAGHDVFQVSSDGGATWQPVQHNLPGTDIHGFAVSPDDPSRLYAFVVGRGTFLSTDSGRTWAKLGGQLPADVMSLAAASGTPDTLFAASMSAGILRSTDGGQTWAPVTARSGRMVYALTVDPANHQVVYAGTDGGLYRSADGGATWNKLAAFPGSNAITVAASPAQLGDLLAIAVEDQQGLVYRSADGGQTWANRP